jgi:pimeloyl-ACP methyl ester carboxylesterase
MEREFDTLIITYPPNIPLSYTALESLVRESLPTDRPFVLLGESFSGPIAISLSARQLPQQVGLVLCSTFARNPRPIFSHLSFFAKRTAAQPYACRMDQQSVTRPVFHERPARSATAGHHSSEPFGNAFTTTIGSCR